MGGKLFVWIEFLRKRDVLANAMTTKREVEIKLRVPDLAGLLGRLKEFGAKCAGSVHEENTLYDTSTRDFQRMQAILRMRRERAARPPGKARRRGKRIKGAGGLITYKEMVGGKRGADGGKYKVREEIEYRVKNAGRIERLFARLGLRRRFRYEKYRTRYELAGFPGLEVDLDETQIGTFLELEGSRRAIDSVARALGYTEKDYIAVSYLELYLAECERQGEKPGNMVFKSKNN
ncbi:MAG TPA: class IV adenylate cyclase [Candidatus Acidoferrales bacterium]|nr:class IV adenylate cyclase [Candidatus Acidoferrales bacterium]